MKLAIATSLMLLQVQCPPFPVPTPSPTPEPSPTATSTPAPTPTAMPTPSPVATPTPTPESPRCDLPPSTGRCEDRPSDTSHFVHAVIEAQEGAAAAGFVKNGKVVNEKAYIGEVVRRLRANSGLCAINGREGGHTSDDEVWVRSMRDRSRSEHFDIIISDGAPWTHYAARCFPAAF